VERSKPRAAWLFRFLLVTLPVLIASLALPASAEMPATSAPKPLARGNPVYPVTALKRGVEGSVLLEFCVDANGNVVAPRVLEAKPRGVFEHAALEAIAKWKYEAPGAQTSPMKVRLTFRNGW
jgi:protein TonB